MSNATLLGSYGGQENSSLMFRNRIINGNCLIGQRGGIFLTAPTQSVYGGCDRFLTGISGYTTLNSSLVSQKGFDPLPGNTSTGLYQNIYLEAQGSGIVTFQQRIEDINCKDLNGKYVTVSLALFQNTGNTLSPTINLYKPNGINAWTNSTFISGTTVSLPSGIWTNFTYTTRLGSTDASKGLGLVINIPTLGPSVNANFGIGDVQLEAGLSASPIEHRPVGVELLLCQRYYEDNSRSGNLLNLFSGNVTSGVNYYYTLPFKVTKRTIPSVGLLTITNLTNYGFSLTPSTPTHYDYDGIVLNRTANATVSGGIFGDRVKIDTEIY